MESRLTSDRLLQPYFLNTVEELDELARPIAVEYLGRKSKPVSIFVSPANSYPRNYRFKLIPQKILVFSDHGVLQISYPEKRREKPAVSSLEADEILSVKNNMYLLYGKLEIWSAKDNVAPIIDIEYNTVAHYSLRPFVRDLIEQSWSLYQRPEIKLEPDNSYNEFFDISFGFYNGILTEGLHNDETVLSLVYQPEMYKKHLKLFKKKITPATCFAFTNKQLIILQQDIRYRVHHEWLFTFIAWDQCKACKIDKEEFWANCQLQIGNEFPVTFLMDSQTAEHFHETFSKWKPVK